jgi:arylsulfatase A-like enzyme
MKQRSLVLVTVDCLRADHVGFSGYPRPVTPFLDSLAPDSLVFSDAIVAGAPTYFSFPGILASRYPLALGRDVLGIAPYEPTIATVLRDAGYSTAAFLAGNPYLSARFGYDQGFDRFCDSLDALGGESDSAERAAKRPLTNLNRQIQAGSRQTGLTAAAYDELYFWYGQWRTAQEKVSMDSLRRYPAADVMVDQACSWLGDVAVAPFFLWIHLMDPHHPYYPPEQALAALGESRITPRRARFLNSFWNRGDVGVRRLQRFRDEIVCLYEAGVYWVDKQISRLVRVLQDSQRWDETMVVVTADHGEEFLEHGARYHSPMSLPKQLIHVPLLLRAPEVPGRRLSPATFSLIHLAPTLLNGLGVPVPNSFQGRSCWDQISLGNLVDEPAIVECVEACNNPFRREDRMRSRLLAVRSQTHKLVINFRTNMEYFYDLKSDPEERSPLPPGVLPRQRAHLLQVAHQHIQRTAHHQNADLRLRARLRDLQHSAVLQRGKTSAPPVRENAGGTTIP